MLKMSSTTWLCSNIVDPTTKQPVCGCQRKALVTWNGIRVGMMGIVENWLSMCSKVLPHEVEYQDMFEVAEQLRDELRALNSVTLFGPEESAGIVSFAIEGVHPHDLGTILDEENVAIRAGHHCAQPLMDHLGVPATARASFGLYSDENDIAALLRGIERTQRIFG